jgi:hypothetical protein
MGAKVRRGFLFTGGRIRYLVTQYELCMSAKHASIGRAIGHVKITRKSYRDL